MEYDQQKVDDAVLALLCLTMHDKSEHGCRAWKGYDWSVMVRLHESGFIGDPKNNAKSVVLTPEGMERARKLFQELFAKKS